MKSRRRNSRRYYCLSSTNLEFSLIVDIKRNRNDMGKSLQLIHRNTIIRTVHDNKCLTRFNKVP